MLSSLSLKTQIKTILRTDNLRSEEKAFLVGWLADPRADDIWSKIEPQIKEKHGEVIASAVIKIFIREIIGGLMIASHPPDSKTMLKQADNAESLAKYLRGPSLGSLPPILPNSDNLIASLVLASSTLRRMAQQQIKMGVRQVSRIDRNGSRKRGAFMWWMTETLRSFCGQPFDEAAAFFTDIAFPDQEADVDRIRNTRRPRTRAARRKL